MALKYEGDYSHIYIQSPDASRDILDKSNGLYRPTDIAVVIYAALCAALPYRLDSAAPTGFCRFYKTFETT
jgi:hypothetical protein